MKIRFFSLLFVLCVSLSLLCAQNNVIAPVVPSAETLQRGFGLHDRAAFVAPDKVFYPETWFHFIGGNVSREGITADLEAIAEAGISGIHFFHGQAGGKWPATGEDIACMSEKWEDAVRFVADECRRLGLRFTMQNCPGWAMSGGPWIKPENAMRLIVSSNTNVTADGAVEVVLPQPQPSNEEWRDYKDIAVLAFPTPLGAKNPIPAPARVSGTGERDWEGLIKNSRHLGLPGGGNTHSVEVVYDGPTVIRTLELSPVQRFNHAMCYDPEVRIAVFAINAAGVETKVADAPMPQSNWQDGSLMTLACSEVADAVKYRVDITNLYNMSLQHMKLMTVAHKNNYEAEAAWTLRGFERTGEQIVQSPAAYLKSSQIMDVTSCMDKDGLFSWMAPYAGEWTILRIGHINAGRKNAPAPPSGTGWECDKLSYEGPQAHFEGYIGHLADGALKGGMLNGLLLDSWECNTQTWTDKMEQEFKQNVGYDLRCWLPTMWGYVIDSPETTSRFLRDWRSNIGELFANRFYKRMAELGKEKGLSVIYETAAGDVFPADIMEYFKYADVPMCEYWHPFSLGYVGDLNFKPIKPTASAARLYGKPRVNAEAFTSFDLNWDEHWEMLKEVADFNAVEGVTHNVFHTYTHNPQIDYLKPGTSFGSSIGTPFLRGQTWWRHMNEFTSYLARCSYMLERGKAVSDVLWYLGDEIGHKPNQKYPFPAGYRFDYCNPDVLLNRLSVKNGRVVTPEGLSYRFIWIPENKRMLSETLERLHALMRDGAVVVASAPKCPATLAGGARAQRRFDRAVRAIWGKAVPGSFRRIGKGGILSGVTLERAIEILDVRADVVADGVRWLHRCADGAHWYFVTPEQGMSFCGEVKFRAAGNVEQWDAVTGEIVAVEGKRVGEYTSVSLSLDRGGSCFVVFSDGEAAKVAAPVKPTREKPLDTQWKLTFPKGWGAPDELVVDCLVPWKELDVAAEAKAFSGTVTYSTTFIADSSMCSNKLMLDLGRVDMIAVVKVNGKVLRTLWCAPYSVDISSAVVEGENELVVEVTSTWFNRLVYDASLPEQERKTWTIAGPSANRSLRDSGLLGPVFFRY
ncbi:MAG: hypothetical protein IKV23_01610 [Bacteroidaceae bacterium]|nr:hypothetical protein [Bacteroidaceae bacterium]